MEKLITRVEKDDWERAQSFELKFAEKNFFNHDDWNLWWKEKFENYDFFDGKKMDNVLEIGCGPNTNVRYILSKIKYEHLFLEDPLINQYVVLNKKNIRMIAGLLMNMLLQKNKESMLMKLIKGGNVDTSSFPAENLPYKDKSMDLVICINVLDHVYDFEKCMLEMNRVLKDGGHFVFGQDLTNTYDLENCPEAKNDIGHPIKIDENILAPFLDAYEKFFHRVLGREEGRNPKAHYATCLFIGKK